MAQFKVTRVQTFIVDLPGADSTEEFSREMRKGRTLDTADLVNEGITGVELVGDSENETDTIQVDVFVNISGTRSTPVYIPKDTDLSDPEAVYAAVYADGVKWGTSRDEIDDADGTVGIDRNGVSLWPGEDAEG